MRVGLLLGLLLAAVLPARADSLDDRVRAVASRLMCPVCEGRTVADSTSELAAQMRALIRERLARGDSEEEVVRYFVDRYGPSVLAVPPPRGVGVALWALPALVVGAGLTYVVWRFRGGAPAEGAGEA